MITPKFDLPTAAAEHLAYEMVIIRDRGACIICGSHEAVQRDHRRNRSQGGRTVVENLQLLCHLHHTWKTEHPKDATDRGWAVPGWAHPTEWPARRVIVTENRQTILSWCLYLPDGTVQAISAREAGQRMSGEWT